VGPALDNLSTPSLSSSPGNIALSEYYEDISSDEDWGVERKEVATPRMVIPRKTLRSKTRRAASVDGKKAAATARPRRRATSVETKPSAPRVKRARAGLPMEAGTSCPPNKKAKLELSPLDKMLKEARAATVSAPEEAAKRAGVVQVPPGAVPVWTGTLPDLATAVATPAPTNEKASLLGAKRGDENEDPFFVMTSAIKYCDRKREYVVAYGRAIPLRSLYSHGRLYDDTDYIQMSVHRACPKLESFPVEVCDHLAHGHTKTRSKRPFTVTGAVGEDIFVTHEMMPGGHWRALLPATAAELYITFHVPSSCHTKPADAVCTQTAYGDWALSLTFSESYCTETVTEVLPLRVIQRLRSKDPDTVRLDNERRKAEREQAGGRKRDSSPEQILRLKLRGQLVRYTDRFSRFIPLGLLQARLQEAKLLAKHQWLQREAAEAEAVTDKDKDEDGDEDEDEDEDMEADEPLSMDVDVGDQWPKLEPEQESAADRHWKEWNTFGSSGSRADHDRIFAWQSSSTGVGLGDDGTEIGARLADVQLGP
jgi:hypothetical protein